MQALLDMCTLKLYDETLIQAYSCIRLVVSIGYNVLRENQDILRSQFYKSWQM